LGVIQDAGSRFAISIEQPIRQSQQEASGAGQLTPQQGPVFSLLLDPPQAKKPGAVGFGLMG
jgi:hypothetical protein